MTINFGSSRKVADVEKMPTFPKYRDGRCIFFHLLIFTDGKCPIYQKSQIREKSSSNDGHFGPYSSIP